MSTNLPNKSSSRAGRFKKKLVPQEALEKEAPVIQERMTPLLELFQQGQLSANEFTAIYILCVLSYRYPGAWLGAKRSEKLTKDNKLSFPLQNLNFPFEPNIQKRLKVTNGIAHSSAQGFNEGVRHSTANDHVVYFV